MSEDVKMEIDGFYECVELMRDEEKDITVQFSNIDGPGSECVCISLGGTNYSVYGIAEILRDKESDLVEDQVVTSAVWKAEKVARDSEYDACNDRTRMLTTAYEILYRWFPYSVARSYIDDAECQDGYEYWNDSFRLQESNINPPFDSEALVADVRCYMANMDQNELVNVLMTRANVEADMARMYREMYEEMLSLREERDVLRKEIAELRAK